MRFGSIKKQITVLACLCVAVTALLLTGFSAVSSWRSRDYVAENVQDLTVELTRQRLQSIADVQAGVIRSTLDEAFDSARNMARAFEAVMSEETATPIESRRAQLNAILRRVLEDNPGFNGTYSAWEPNALDGRDAEFVNEARAGSDATGRFLPYWTRDSNGKIDIQPLVEYDSRALHPNGVMKGGWYIGPQNGGGESILDPLPYIVQGKHVYLATMSVPIEVDGRFLGVAGADFDLAFVQDLAERVQRSLFDGAAHVDIISHMGLVVASSGDADAIGARGDAVVARFDELMPTIEAGEPAVIETADAFQALSPIEIGRTRTPWSVVVTVPTEVALAETIALDDALAARGAADAMLLALAGLAVAGVGLFVMWRVAKSISEPIGVMTTAMRRVADGDLEAEIPGADRTDELGAMAGAVAVFRDNALTARRLEKEAEEQRAQNEAERRRVAEAERLKAEETAQATSRIGEGLKRLAEGDLAFRLDEPFAEAFESLREDFNRSVGQLAQALSDVADAAQVIDGGAAGIREGADTLSQRTEQQAASLEQTAAALHELLSNVANAAERAKEARDAADAANGRATQSSKVVEDAVDAMQRIQSSSEEIGAIISVIDEIAFQTNLLALNASVEAARAGQAGSGFAVVAQEVRGLAQRCANAAKDISGLIQKSGSEVANGVKLVSDTGQALAQIVTDVAGVNDQVEAIARGAQEQSAGLSEISTAVNEMDQMTQRNAAMVAETNASSADLTSEAARLRTLISTFRLDAARGAAARTGAAA
jgi:methyl-accepting chemotaxis protein